MLFLLNKTSTKQKYLTIIQPITIMSLFHSEHRTNFSFVKKIQNAYTAPMFLIEGRKTRAINALSIRNN